MTRHNCIWDIIKMTKWYSGSYSIDFSDWENDPLLHDRFANEMAKKIGIHYETPIDGTFTLYWPNGVKRYEWDYKDGKRVDGKSLSWWPNGKIKIIRNWVNGKHHGLQQEFYTDGTIWLEEMVTEESGTFIEYDTDGSIMQTGSFNLDYMETGDYGVKLSQPYWDDNWNEDSNTTK